MIFFFLIIKIEFPERDMDLSLEFYRDERADAHFLTGI